MRVTILFCQYHNGTPVKNGHDANDSICSCSDQAGERTSARHTGLLPDTTGKRRRSAIDGRTTRHEGYGMSQSCRAMIECIFGWGKQHGTMRKTKHRGLASVSTDFMLNFDAYNLIELLC